MLASLVRRPRPLAVPAAAPSRRQRVVAGAFAAVLLASAGNVAVSAYAADILLDGSSVLSVRKPAGPPPPPGPPVSRAEACAAVQENFLRFSLTDLDDGRVGVGAVVLRADDSVLAGLGRQMYVESTIHSGSPEAGRRWARSRAGAPAPADR